MIKFYTNKELSQKFNVNLARWKRWSREFLAPDPLGGLQSGYARQYNPDETFTVVLGGHLLGVLKFSVPETKQILVDLHQWLLDHGFYFYVSNTSESDKHRTSEINQYQLFISNRAVRRDKERGLSYWARAIISVDSTNLNGDSVKREYYRESSIGPKESESPRMKAESYRVLNISVFRTNFLNKLQA
ncbi:MAG: hypothetical protein PVH37_28275 [Desulfobacterales bacterium]|jgi:hypothetical protein